MKKHHVKTSPHFFELAWARRKPVEIRFNDRDYRPGDELYLHEWVSAILPEDPPDPYYSGRCIANKIREVHTRLNGLESGYAFLVLDQVAFVNTFTRTIDLTGIIDPSPPPHAGLPTGDIES